jgi:uncharacterized protein (TIGR02145 family)
LLRYQFRGSLFIIAKMIKKYFSFVLIFLMLYLYGIRCSKEEKPPDPVEDIEGNIYKTIKAGTQIWMAENLKTTKYNDGTDIPLVQDTEAWEENKTPGYCWYNNEETKYKDPYGALYNGYAVNTGNLCPTGWHVPSREEWQILRDFEGDTLKGGGKLREAGTAHWLSPNKGADNSSGFTALPAGIRYFEGSFASVLSYTAFWSSTETGTEDQWYTGLYFGDAAFTMDHKRKRQGFSVRCIKD